MPQFNKLSSDQVEDLQPAHRGLPPVDLTEYTDFLQGTEPDAVYAMSYDDVINRRAAKRRVTAAAKSLGKTVKYFRTSGEVNEVVFSVN